ncbi:MAG: aspartate aminotransferase family protein [Thermomicrobiales bacterium]
MAEIDQRRDAFRALSSASAALAERARIVMPGGNTRTTVYQSPHPPYAAYGKGATIVDVEGDTRLDFINNYTSLIHGHADPDIIAAVIEQLQYGTSYAMPTVHEVALAELIAERIPSVEQLRFTNSGTEAVMMAIKGARAFTGRPKIVKFEGCYHGSYDFAEISQVTPESRWEEAETPATATAFGTPQGVMENVLVARYNDRADAERVITRHHNEIAAVLVDPMPSRVGNVPATHAFLSALREMTRTYGIVLIFDEVITLRVAYGGMQSVVGVTPDMTTMAKIIGGGFPVGAVGGAAEIMAVFDPSKGPKVPHGGTFNANPITSIAGLIAMEKMTPEEFDRINALGERLREGLAEAMDGARVPGQVTGAGSVFNLHLHNRPLTDYRSTVLTPAEKARTSAVYQSMLAHGIFMSPSMMGCISTPMGTAEIATCVDAFGVALHETAG